MTRIDLLHRHCADEGVDVSWLDLGPVRRGQYLDDLRLIEINVRLTRCQATATLAHEVGHAFFRDRMTTPANETRAWEFGASLIVTPSEYASAEMAVGCHVGALADELEVTPALIEAWRRWYLKRHPWEASRFERDALDPRAT